MDVFLMKLKGEVKGRGEKELGIGLIGFKKLKTKFILPTNINQQPIT